MAGFLAKGAPRKMVPGAKPKAVLTDYCVILHQSKQERAGKTIA
jgi:hypothetical protein